MAIHRHLPVVLGLLAVLVILAGCDDGSTRVRPRADVEGTVSTPTEEGLPPGSQCRAAAQFGLSVRQQRTPTGPILDAGTAWATGGHAGVTDVWATTDQFVIGLQAPQPDLTQPYAGTMTITWTVDGRDVDAAPAAGSPLTRLEVSGRDKDDLWAQFVVRDRQWRQARYAFRIDPPGGARQVVVTARAAWRTRDGRECDARTSFHLHWLAPEAMAPFPDEVPLPVPFTRDALAHREDDRRLHLSDGATFVVTPLRYVWSVQSTQPCCGRQVPHRVVQFARAVLDSEVAHLRRLKPWALDVTQSQKDQANRGERFDPGLTQKPGQTDTQVNTHPGSEPAVSHWDGPGLSEVRYRQLLLTPGRHVLRQQFFSLLVCAGSRTGTADSLRDDYRVEKAAVFTITWTFDGPADDPGRVDVRAMVNDRRPIGCKTLREVLQANGLVEAFLHPVAAALERTDLPRPDLQRLLDLGGIVVPP